jgi:Tfp pilus assembly protein PilO
MSQRSFSLREQKIFFVLLVVFGIYGAYMGIYRPSVDKNEEIERNAMLARKKWMEQARLIQKEKRMAQAWQAELDSVRQTGSNEQVMSAMLSEIENVAAGGKIRVTEMKPQGAVKSEFYNTFSISLSFDGELKDVLSFIHVLQNPSRHLNLRQLNLERSGSDAKGMMAKMVLERQLFP